MMCARTGLVACYKTERHEKYAIRRVGMAIVNECNFVRYSSGVAIDSTTQPHILEPAAA